MSDPRDVSSDGSVASFGFLSDIEHWNIGGAHEVVGDAVEEQAPGSLAVVLAADDEVR